MLPRALLAALAALLLALPALAGPPGFSEHRFNGRDPEWRQGVATFHVKNGDCSPIKYGDGRGESDCHNGNLRSRYAYRQTARPGQALEYRMEIYIPADLRYGGGPNRRSLLEIAEWQRVNTVKNHIHTLHLDSNKGLTFDDTRCLSPREFGRWNSFVMRVKWSTGADGFLQVICNGKTIIDYRGQTAIPRDCGQRGVYQCEPALQEPRKPVQFQVGILFRGWSEHRRAEGLNPAGRTAPASGFTVHMRNIAVSRLRGS